MDRVRETRPGKVPSFSESLFSAFARDFKISGFTFVRNGVKFGYPFRESILSALTIVDEFVVNVGDCTDGTLEVVQELAAEHPKIKIIESTWDTSVSSGGKVLADQTNIALQACTGDWGLYLQADEVIHEDDFMWILDAFKNANRDPRAEGILFDYLHFYGDYRVVNWHPSAYRHEIRGVRIVPGLYSYGDAQGFRKRARSEGSTETEVAGKGQKLKVLSANARIYHYGWVRPPEIMHAKTLEMDTFYHPPGEGTGDNYKYKRVIGLEKYTGTHPRIMQERVSQQTDWSDKLLSGPLSFESKDIVRIFYRYWEKLFGRRPFEYRNYELLCPKKRT